MSLLYFPLLFLSAKDNVAKGSVAKDNVAKGSVAKYNVAKGSVAKGNVANGNVTVKEIKACAAAEV
jgi:hypothetical protein